MTHQYMEIKIKELEKRIKALEQEPCEDCISREKAIIRLSWDLSDVPLPKIKESLDKLPSVTPKPKSDVLDEIKAEIEQEYKPEREHHYGQGLRRALEIIDKYRIEGEDISEWNKCINEMLEVIDKYKAENEDK